MSETLITALQLRLFAAQSDYLALAPRLDLVAQQNAITTSRRIRHFLSRLYVESGGFTRFSEGLFYTHAERICEVWPRRFPTPADAAPYARNPEALADKVYGGRMGNSAPGDGFRYRGRGLIQLTGRDNYAKAQGWSGLNLLANPDQASEPGAASAIAATFWRTHGCNEAADADDGERICATLDQEIRANEFDDAGEVTRIVNGGALGLADYERQLLRAAAIWRN